MKKQLEGDMERDANKALEQIEEMNYQNSENLPNIIHTLQVREYGIAGFHLSIYIKGRYLELDGQNQKKMIQRFIEILVFFDRIIDFNFSLLSQVSLRGYNSRTVVPN